MTPTLQNFVCMVNGECGLQLDSREPECFSLEEGEDVIHVCVDCKVLC